MKRPNYIDGDEAELYDWFAANGIDELLPEHPEVWIDGDKLHYKSFLWEEGKRGWDYSGIHVPPRADEIPLEDRTMPLLVPPTDRIRYLAPRVGVRIHDGHPQRCMTCGEARTILIEGEPYCSLPCMPYEAIERFVAETECGVVVP